MPHHVRISIGLLNIVELHVAKLLVGTAFPYRGVAALNCLCSDLLPAPQSIEDACHIRRELNACADEAEAWCGFVDGDILVSGFCERQRSRKAAHAYIILEAEKYIFQSSRNLPAPIIAILRFSAIVDDFSNGRNMNAGIKAQASYGYQKVK